MSGVLVRLLRSRQRSLEKSEDRWLGHYQFPTPLEEWNSLMHETPQSQHEWLARMVGKWTCEMECSMGPDQPPIKSTGTEETHTLGGLWVVSCGTMSMPGGDEGKSMMTLGFSPRSGKFVGSFHASMMTQQWIYCGSLDESGKILTLDTEGLNFTQTALARYQDVIEIPSADVRTMYSQILQDDGTWLRFMNMTYRRIG